MPDFDTLPVEILHRIFDNLDVQTILFSIRHVCRRFYSIANSYRFYHFNFESISKAKFHLVCRLVPFEHVVSLTLSNKDKTHGQIPLFLALFNLNQFVRLRSLTLHQIEDEHLNIFLNSIVHSSLISLTIDSQTLSIRQNTSLNLLSSTLEHPTLRKLDLNMWPKDLNELRWPMNGILTYLRIRTSITLNQFYLILHASPCLTTMIIKDFNLDQICLYIDGQFPQLTSLTCENGRIQMDKLEQCLTLTPALVHLKLIGGGTLTDSSFDGSRWEKLIETYLPWLEKFEFSISVLTHFNFDTNNIEQIISLFETPFWLDEKHWFFQCDYIIYLHQLTLYSIPICTEYFEYHSEANKVSAWNFDGEDRDSMMMMENVPHLHLNLTKIIPTEDENAREISNRRLFPNITELRLGIDGDWPRGSHEFLSTTINLTHITKLSLSVNFSHEFMPSIVPGIHRLLEHASNVHTLYLFDYQAPDHCTIPMETVYALITSNIKHLQIRVKNSDDIKFIIDNCDDLISVTFHYALNLVMSNADFFDCLSRVKRRFSKWKCQYALHIWLS